MGEQIMAGYIGLLIGVHIAGAVILLAGAIRALTEFRSQQSTGRRGQGPG